MITTNFTSAVVSQYHGKNDFKSCARVPWAGFWFALFSGLFISFTMRPVGIMFLEFSNHQPEVLSKEIEYFSILMCGGGFVCLNSAFSSFFNGQGRTWTVAIIQFICCIVNIVLDYILIFGKFGFPEMGITGAALATTAAMILAFLISFGLFLLQNQKKFPTWAVRGFYFADLKRLFKFGAPSGFQVLCEVGAFTVMIFLIGKTGKSELAASTIILSINMLSFLPLLALAEAASISVGRYIGKMKKHISKKAAFNTWRMALIHVTFMSIMFLIFPKELISVFAPSGENSAKFANVREIAEKIIYCVVIFNFFEATMFSFLGSLRGAGDTSASMRIIISVAWGVWIPITVIGIYFLNFGVISVWAIYVVYVFIIGILLFRRFNSDKWQKIKIIEPVSSVEPETIHLESDVPWL